MQLIWQKVEEIDSTNTALKVMGLSGAPEGTVLQAGCQTGGRGRMGRTFFSPAGGVYCSVLLRRAAHSGLVTVAAAVAAAEAAEAVTGRPVGIKWVNDLILDGKKVCGILAERVAAPAGDFTVVGFGINLTPPPGGFPPQVAEVAGALLPAAPGGTGDALARDLTERFVRYLELPSGAYLPGYRARSVLTGRTVTCQRGHETFSAAVIGIDGEGRLLVRRDGGGEEALQSGEVTLHGGVYGRL